jgi:hypothetical protein
VAVLGAIAFILIMVLAGAGKLLVMSPWFPPARHWSLRVRVLVWAVFAAGMAACAFFVYMGERSK